MVKEREREVVENSTRYGNVNGFRNVSGGAVGVWERGFLGRVLSGSRSETSESVLLSLNDEEKGR